MHEQFYCFLAEEYIRDCIPCYFTNSLSVDIYFLAQWFHDQSLSEKFHSYLGEPSS